MFLVKTSRKENKKSKGKVKKAGAKIINSNINGEMIGVKINSLASVNVIHSFILYLFSL